MCPGNPVVHFYVYYRIAPCHAADAEAPIRAMLTRLACRFGVNTNLLKKCDEPLLWMEVYANVADTAGFERELDRAADEYDVSMLIDGQRHVECFESA